MLIEHCFPQKAKQLTNKSFVGRINDGGVIILHSNLATGLKKCLRKVTGVDEIDAEK